MLDLSQSQSSVESGVVAAVEQRDLVTAVGTDAASYLHGQLSQNVEALSVGDSAWTLLLQPQGKVDAWMRLSRLAEDRFGLDLDAGHGVAALARLERFKLRVEVGFELAEVTVVALRGPGAVAADRSGIDGVVAALDASWGGIEGCDLLLEPDADPISVVEALAVPLGPPELAETVRVAQGRPAMGAELDESTIPAAAGVVDASVDFTKGCYVGQELVARVDSRGNNTPFRLHRLRFTDGAPAVGAELALDGAAVGRVTSVASWLGDVVGLGYLKRGVDAPVRLTAGPDAVALEAVPLD
jgi:folate-binding protein YgfZ